MALTKIALRNAWFQAHKWIGLILAALIVPLCVSGAALVWHDALDEAVNPQRYAVTADAPAKAPAAYAEAARAVLAPGERIASLRFEPGAPVVVMASKPMAPGAKGRPQRTTVWLDPGTARVLDKAGGNDGLVRFLHQLHGSFFVPGVGRALVGWLGVAMLVSSISGLWLWWPTAGAWTRGFRWRRHRNFDTNLHHQFGFWIALPLFVLSLTGAWISFPAFFAGISGDKPPAGGEARFRAAPLAAPAQDLGTVVAAARGKAQGTLAAVTWPTDQKPVWTVSIKPAAGKPVTVAVEDAGGAASIDRAGQPNAGGTARLMRKLHDGTDMGMVWQVLIFLGGVLPAVLAITGVIMWWRARGWRATLRQRMAR